MRKLSGFLVEKRRVVFIVMMLLSAVSLFLIPKVRVNTDMTKYLPKSSPMKQGIDIMAGEFAQMSVPDTVRVMFRGVPEEEREKLLAEMKETPHVDSVSFIPGDARYEKGDYILFLLNFSCGFFSSEMQEAETYIKEHFSGRYEMTYCLDKTTQQGIPGWIVVLAVSLLLVILLLFSYSWLEPFLFLFAMGIAILINMGTNILLPDVSETTWSIAAILQLALSIDYSVILLGRYRQELSLTDDTRSAMKNAIQKAFSSIAGSAFTTVTGFLTLLFMSFRIGMDMGIVLAKGVFFSMVSILTILPFLVLALDPLIRKTQKKVLTLRMEPLGWFSYRFRRIITVFFVIFFAAVAAGKGQTGIAFTLLAPNDVDPVFPKENQIVVLYENADEEGAASMVRVLEADPSVNSVFAWSNTLGKAFTPRELLDFLSSMDMDMGIDLSVELLEMVYKMCPEGEDGRLTLSELMTFASETFSQNSLFAGMMGEDRKEALEQAPVMLQEAEKQIRGEKHSIMAISTSLPAESDETSAFLQRLKEMCGEHLSGPYYLIGNSPMAAEMTDTFAGELNFLTLLTAAAIFVVVMITFRSLAVPAVLVLLIQSAVYATMVMMNLQGMEIYYIALLVVQSILMGATIDYAIVFTNYYREMRAREDVQQALIHAYGRSAHTILTSGCIVISVTAVVGFAFSDPAVRQIVHTISKGAAIAVILILFVLPGILACLDRFIVRAPKKGQEKSQ